VIFKTKKGKGAILKAVFSAVFLIVLAGAVFLYASKNKKTGQDNVPPIIRQVAGLNKDIKKTTIDLYNASEKLDSLSMVQSRITDIRSAIELIGELRQMVKANQNAVDTLILFIEAHEDFFRRKNLSWIFAIKEFYTNHNVVQHHKSRANFLAAFEALLQYTYKNFQNIMVLKSPQYIKGYDVYYMRYRRAADSHNRFNKKRIAFQTAFVEEHPEVKSLLPGAHHLGSFKFWDKFSF